MQTKPTKQKVKKGNQHTFYKFHHPIYSFLHGFKKLDTFTASSLCFLFDKISQ